MNGYGTARPSGAGLFFGQIADRKIKNAKTRIFSVAVPIPPIIFLCFLGFLRLYAAFSSILHFVNKTS